MGNEVNIDTLLITLLVSLVGGITKFLHRTRFNRNALSIHALLSAITLSLFTGLLGGVLCFNFGFSLYETVFVCGIASFICDDHLYR